MDITLSAAATKRAIVNTNAPKLIGDNADKHEINNVIMILLIINKVIGRPYNKR